MFTDEIFVEPVGLFDLETDTFDGGGFFGGDVDDEATGWFIYSVRFSSLLLTVCMEMNKTKRSTNLDKSSRISSNVMEANGDDMVMFTCVVVMGMTMSLEVMLL